MIIKQEVCGRGKYAWSRITATDANGWVQVMGSYYPKERSAYLWRKGDRTRGTPLRDISIEDLRARVEEEAANVRP